MLKGQNQGLCLHALSCLCSIFSRRLPAGSHNAAKVLQIAVALFKKVPCLIFKSAILASALHIPLCLNKDLMVYFYAHDENVNKTG